MPWYIALFVALMLLGLFVLGVWTAIFDRDPVDRLRGGAVAFCIFAAATLTYLEVSAR